MNKIVELCCLQKNNEENEKIQFASMFYNVNTSISTEKRGTECTSVVTFV